MINYPIYLSVLAVAGIILFFLLKFIRKKYLFLKHGFRTRATVIEVVKHHGDQMVEFGFVPVIRFKGRNGQMKVLKTDIFLERFVTNAKLQVGYEFDIIYEGDDVDGMIELSRLKGVIATYGVVAIFPAVIILMLLIGLFY